ncbi:MAG: hypothetical protein GY854_12905 [Deltaproteobacteria bacterium]|nr:hypothetical protein [Deltaproteobacteria bacterium]
MPPRNERDEHSRLRLYVLFAAGVLLVAIVTAAISAYRTPWRKYQTGFQNLDKADNREPPGILQYAACDDNVDRCPTCHLGIERADLKSDKIPPLYRAHGPGIGPHRPEKFGCSSCHGGNGRALTPDSAHMLANHGGVDPLMHKPHIQASCARCHVPGSTAGQDRLVQGANLYLGLGCAVCHPLTDGGRGGWDFGPDLTAVGRKSLDYLRTSLIDPTANFKGSTMPSFQLALDKEPEAMESLLVYLESLALERSSDCNERTRSRGLVEKPCADCHAGAGGSAGGRMRHRCVFLLERTKELSCANCHSTEIPKPGAGKGYCALIKQHRKACAACHDGV